MSTQSLEQHFGALRSALEPPLHAPAFASPRIYATHMPWQYVAQLPRWLTILQLARAGRRTHKRRWDEQVLPYITQQLDASWPDALRVLPEDSYRDVLATPCGDASPTLSLIRALNLDHRTTRAQAALTDGRLAHITHLTLPARIQSWSSPHLISPLSCLINAQLPALTHLTLLTAGGRLDELCHPLQHTELPALTHLTLNANLDTTFSAETERLWRALSALPALARLRSLSLRTVYSNIHSQNLNRWLTLLHQLPALRALDLRWSNPDHAQIERLADAPCFPHLDALDLIQRADAEHHLLRLPNLPSPTHLALMPRAERTEALLASPLLSRVTSLELWPQLAHTQLAALATHPQWRRLEHLALHLRSPEALHTLVKLPAPDALRSLRVSWRGERYAHVLDPQRSMLASWSGLTPTLRVRRNALLLPAAHTTP